MTLPRRISDSAQITTQGMEVFPDGILKTGRKTGEFVMKKRTIQILSILAVSFCAISGRAQNAPTLTLKEAEQIALKNHPSVIAARDNALASVQTAREVRSAYFPVVEGDVTGSVAGRNTRIGAGYLTDSRLFNRFGQGVTVGQLITDFGRTGNLVASARLQANAADEDAQSTRYSVLLGVNHAYFEVLRAQALLKVAQTTLAERQVILDQVTALVKNKLKSDLDLSFAQVNVAQAKLLEIQTRNNLKIAWAQLARAMGLETIKSYKLVESPLPPAPPASPEPLVLEAWKYRPEILSLALTDRSAYKFERAERDLSFPTVTAVGVAGALPLITQLNPAQPIPEHYEAAAVDIEIPVFNGHLFAARREEAMLRARAADEQLENMKERIARDVRIAWANASTSYQQIDVADKFLNQAKLSLALAQGRYNLGLSSMVALSQAQLNETQAEIQAVNAKYDFEDRNATLEYETGLLR
jgi:outer membrane protein